MTPSLAGDRSWIVKPASSFTFVPFHLSSLFSLVLAHAPDLIAPLPCVSFATSHSVSASLRGSSNQNTNYISSSSSKISSTAPNPQQKYYFDMPAFTHPLLPLLL